MKGFLSVLLLVAVGAWADPEFGAALGPSPAARGLQVLTRGQVKAVLTLAATKHWNLFDLVDEGALWLGAQGRRAVLRGEDLVAMTKEFDLGDTRIDTLVPVAHLVTLTMGRGDDGQASVEIVLDRPLSGFLELGDFFLADHYGFRALDGKTLGKAYGLRVKTGLMTWDILQIVRVPDPTGHNDPNFIAIYAQGFWRPKQWQIDPVRILAAPMPKP